MAESSIYNVSVYGNSTTYSKNDIVYHPSSNGQYYYSLVNNNIGNTPTSAANSYWGGYRSYSSASAAGVSAPEFIWVSNYASEIQSKPSMNLVKFGDGYEQRTEDGINNTLLKLNLTFEGRDKQETRAITHFVSKRRGAQHFFFDAPFPYNFDSTSQNFPKRFICEDWSIRYVFFNNYNISTTFIETSNI
jgi:phage-related protein